MLVLKLSIIADRSSIWIQLPTSKQPVSNREGQNLTSIEMNHQSVPISATKFCSHEESNKNSYCNIVTVSDLDKNIPWKYAGPETWYSYIARCITKTKKVHPTVGWGICFRFIVKTDIDWTIADGDVGWNMLYRWGILLQNSCVYVLRHLYTK